MIPYGMLLTVSKHLILFRLGGTKAEESMSEHHKRVSLPSTILIKRVAAESHITSTFNNISAMSHSELFGHSCDNVVVSLIFTETQGKPQTCCNSRTNFATYILVFRPRCDR
jgi:hypothetical protein